MSLKCQNAVVGIEEAVSILQSYDDHIQIQGIGFNAIGIISEIQPEREDAWKLRFWLINYQLDPNKTFDGKLHIRQMVKEGASIEFEIILHSEQFQLQHTAPQPIYELGQIKPVAFASRNTTKLEFVAMTAYMRKHQWKYAIGTPRNNYLICHDCGEVMYEATLTENIG
jgi:hypothetical protein